jgi:hypothetical protein
MVKAEDDLFAVVVLVLQPPAFSPVLAVRRLVLLGPKGPSNGECGCGDRRMSQIPCSSRPGPPVPPSLPTRRSGLLRDGLLVLSAAAFGASLVATGRSSPSVAVAEPTHPFSAGYERDLDARLRLGVPGFRAAGTAARRTVYPGPDSAVVHESFRASGAGVDLDVRQVATWERPARLTRVEFRARVMAPGLADLSFSGTAELAGDSVEMVVNVPGQPPARTRVEIPQAPMMAAGFLEPAPVRPLSVGARWSSRAIDEISREVVTAKVEVVEFGAVEVDGRTESAFRAVAQVELETGQAKRYTTWYAPDGRALKEERAFGPVGVVLERAALAPL